MSFGAITISDDTIRQAATGDLPARDKVVEALEPQVRAMIAMRLAPTPAQLEEVDDLAQQCLAALPNALGRLRSQTVAALRSCASTIVSRHVVDFITRTKTRRGAKIQSLDSSIVTASNAGPLWSLLSHSGVSPGSDVSRREQIERVLEGVARLKDSQREVITFAFIDQLPMSEIAERMGVSRPAASMLLVRAVRTLRRNLTGSSRIDCGDGNGL